MLDDGCPKCAICGETIVGLVPAPPTGRPAPVDWTSFPSRPTSPEQVVSPRRQGFTPQTPTSGRTFARRNTTIAARRSPPVMPRGHHFASTGRSPERALSIGANTGRPVLETNTYSIPDDPFYSQPVQPTNVPFPREHTYQSNAGADRASGIAALIKSGGFQKPTTSPQSAFRGGSPPATTPNQVGVHASSLGVPEAAPIRHWGSHLDEVVPDPPFMVAAVHGDGKLPQLQEAVDHIPFVNPAAHIKVPDNGIIKISNIPFTSTKQEILAAIGRNARVVHQPPGSPFYAIHIIMDRNTGKTNEAYVEVDSKDAAQDVMLHYEERRERGRAPKVGDRHVIIEVSNMQTLMAKLFPRVSCVQWLGAVPVPYQPADPYTTGFRGFIMIEECSQLKKHAEDPKKASLFSIPDTALPVPIPVTALPVSIPVMSPFINRSSHRVYEAVVSIVYKYPWYKPELITIGERAILFKTARGILFVLMRAVTAGNDSTALTPQLIQELVCAIITVPFSHKQKHDILGLVVSNGYQDIVSNIGYNFLGELSTHWPFEVLDKKKSVKVAVVQFYASMLHKSSLLTLNTALTEDEAAEISVNSFGALKVAYPSNLKELSIAEVAKIDWDTMIRSLQRILTHRQVRRMTGMPHPDLTNGPSNAPGGNLHSISPAVSPNRSSPIISPVNPDTRSPTRSPVASTDPYNLATYAIPSIDSIAGLGAPGFRTTTADTDQGGVALPRPVDPPTGRLPESLTAFSPGSARRGMVSSEANQSVVSAQDTTTPDRRGRGAASRWQDKRSGMVLPSGVGMRFSPVRSESVDSVASPRRAHFNPAPGGHLRGSPTLPRYSRGDGPPPSYEMATTPPVASPTLEATQSPERIASAVRFPNVPDVADDLPPSEVRVGRPRGSSFLATYGSALVGSGGPESVPTAGGSLDPSAPPFSSPTTPASGGQPGRATRFTPTFAEICGRAGIRLSRPADKSKGKN
ncbi:Hypothetical protein D9617_19g101690 [Elsinoe fawcettii]|nr:Hypothetical protein D9617_19g101690 [Elsinoe fawcettii]